jgi:MFS family permease
MFKGKSQKGHSAQERDSAYRILRIKDFRNYTIARLLYVLAIQMQAVVVSWQVYKITNDPLALGLIGLSEALPSILVALYAGHLADKYPRKRIAILSHLTLLVCSFLLWTFSWNEQSFLVKTGVYPIYLVVILSGVARGFIAPSLFAFMTQIVPKDLYPQSAAWAGTSFQIGAVIGPALGGMLYGFYSVEFAYLTDLLFMTISFLFLIVIPGRPLPPGTKEIPLKDSLLTGIKFVFKNQIILGAMSLDMFAVLFGGAVALLPIFAGEILNVGSEGLGVLRAAPSAGSVLIALILAHYPPLVKSGKILLGSVFGFGISMILFAVSENFLLSLTLLFLSGVFDGASVVIRSTIMQLLTPDDIRGRVSSVNKIFIGSSNEIGAFESGLTAAIMGPVRSVLFGGAMTIFIVFYSRYVFPKLLSLELKNYIKEKSQ